VKNVLALSLFAAQVSIGVGCRFTHESGPVSDLKTPAPLILAAGGKTTFRIVAAANSMPAERTAAVELANYLKKVTGAEFPVVTESGAPVTSPAIYLGWTDFAASHGIDSAGLGAEEWLLRRVGDDLVITGGRQRGTLYGVYDFLERETGVYWLDRDTEVVPNRPELVLGSLNRRAEPAARIRHVHTQFWSKGLGADPGLSERETRFRVHNRGNQAGGRMSGGEARYGGGDYDGPFPTTAHNLHLYAPAEIYFAGHPEYYALDKEGRRVPTDATGTKGQLCLTHPEVRKIALSRLLEAIAADKKRFPLAAGLQPPSIYHVKQHDGLLVCQCPTCQMLNRQEGSESATMIDFVNFLADGVREQYPEVLLETFAYMTTQIPPRTLRPRDNVVMKWCDWYIPGQGHPEPWQPLTHPVNAWRAENLRQWVAISKHLSVWDYGEKYVEVNFPFTMASPVFFDDMRFFFANKTLGFFYENDTDSAVPWQGQTQFSPLFIWLAYRVMLEPDQPVEPLIDVFMHGYYGEAATFMRTFYDRLVQGQRDLPAPRTSGDAIRGIRYVTPAFYAEMQALFDRAEAVCSPDSLELLHVYRERIRLDYTMLANWEQLEDKLPAGGIMPLDRNAAMRRVETRADPLLEKLGYSEKKRKLYIDPLGTQMRRWANPLPLPARFRNLDAKQFYWPDFVESQERRVIVADPEASDGKAMRVSRTDLEYHQKDPVFGVHDPNRKKTLSSLIIRKPEIPQDGKYHWYKLGRCGIWPGTYLYGHDQWRIQLALDRVYVQDDNPDGNQWDVWVSAKFTGPAYVSGSTEAESGFYVDCVVLAPPHGKP
jgi:hypothetical protein